MSITIWNRIEPRTREGKKLRGKDDKTPDPLRRGLQAQVRDPLWFLTRQWQIGEFFGTDGGYPVQATMRVEAHPLTGVTMPPGGTRLALGSSGQPPLEVLAERMTLILGLRGAVQLGRRFETMLRGASPAVPNVDARIADFRRAYPIGGAATQGEIEDRAADRFRLLAAGRSTDGNALFDDAARVLPAMPQKLADAGMTAQQWQDVATIVQDFVGYRRSLYNEPVPRADVAWTREQLRHRFAVDATSLGVSLTAPEFEGGHLDWYDFNSAPLASPPTAAPTSEERTFVPHPVAFRGMPKPRWWTLDDRRTDFGGLDVHHTDTARMLLVEFALLFSDDWFQLSVRVPVGSLSRITLLVVTDTFGIRTLIRPTQHIPAGERPWSMFSLSGDATFADVLFVPPTLGAVLDSEPLEEVTFFRDEMAAMGWAVERTLQSPMDAPVSGYQSYLERLRAHPLPEPPARQPNEPEIQYVLGTTVPDNWIPLVPVSGGQRSFVFRRGLMQRPVAPPPGSPPGPPVLTDVRARGQILEPDLKPFYIHEESVPRSGARVIRRFRCTRWSDGSTHVWVARYVGTGRGQGASGLAFDVVQPLKER